MQEVTGYLHPGYAASLAEFGTPRALPRSGGWLLERQIPGSTHRDAIGPYPLLACRDWDGLGDDLDEIDDLVAVSAVADPFGAPGPDALRAAFRDLVLPFKEHCVIDLRRGHGELSAHHRRYARKALRALAVDEDPDPPAFLEDWMRLHATLVRRHDVGGIRAFSRPAFAAQLALPGAMVTVARRGADAVGAVFWMLQEGEDVVFGHVLGCSPEGYRLGAQYALYWDAIERFAPRVRWCDVAGVPGVADGGATGLAWFKRGWSRLTRTAYLCGRVLDRSRYDELVRARHADGATYFPAYRAGEVF